MGATDAPLAGRVVVVTRPEAEAGELVRRLKARGAEPLLAPAIRLEPVPPEPLDGAVRALASGRFGWLVLTSRAGVQAVLARLEAAGVRPSALATPVAAVGEGTADALRRKGVEPALVPATYTTQALGAAMPPGSGPVLLARADVAPGDLEAAVAAKGWEPVRVDAYRTVLADGLPPVVRRALEGGRVDALTFTSASTVRGFVRAAGPLVAAPGAGPRPAVVCIGPVTAGEAERAGLRVDEVADPHTIEGLVAAVERAVPPLAEEMP